MKKDWNYRKTIKEGRSADEKAWIKEGGKVESKT